MYKDLLKRNVYSKIKGLIIAVLIGLALGLPLNLITYLVLQILRYQPPLVIFNFGDFWTAMGAIATSVGITTAVLWPHLNEKEKEHQDKDFLSLALALEIEHNYNQLISPSIDNSFGFPVYERIITNYTGSLNKTLYPKLLKIVSLPKTYYDIHKRERGRPQPNNVLVTEQHIHLCRELLLQFSDVIYLDNFRLTTFINKLTTHKDSDIGKKLIDKLSNLDKASYPNLSDLIADTKNIFDMLVAESAIGRQHQEYRGQHRAILVDIKDLFLQQIKEQIEIFSISLFS